jgi:hypothetical protein
MKSQFENALLTAALLGQEDVSPDVTTAGDPAEEP